MALELSLGEAGRHAEGKVQLLPTEVEPQPRPPPQGDTGEDDVTAGHFLEAKANALQAANCVHVGPAEVDRAVTVDVDQIVGMTGRSVVVSPFKPRNEVRGRDFLDGRLGR